MKNGISFYTGGFDFNGLKIAYSASVGADYIPDDCRDIMSKIFRHSPQFPSGNSRQGTLWAVLPMFPSMSPLTPLLCLISRSGSKLPKSQNMSITASILFYIFLGTQSDSVKDYISAVGKNIICVLFRFSPNGQSKAIFSMSIFIQPHPMSFCGLLQIAILSSPIRFTAVFFDY